MANPAIVETADFDDDKEAKPGRSRLPAVARRISELAIELEQKARLETERQKKDDGRIRAILYTCSGGGIERMLRKMNLSQSDKTFLQERGWRI